MMENISGVESLNEQIRGAEKILGNHLKRLGDEDAEDMTPSQMIVRGIDYIANAST